MTISVIVIDDDRFRDFTINILGIDYDTLYFYFENHLTDYTLFNEYIKDFAQTSYRPQ